MFKRAVLNGNTNCSPIIPGVVILIVIGVAIYKYRHQIEMTAIAAAAGCVAAGLVWFTVVGIRHMTRESRTTRALGEAQPVVVESKLPTPVGPVQDAQLASYADLLGQDDVQLFGTGRDVVGKRVKTER